MNSTKFITLNATKDSEIASSLYDNENLIMKKKSTNNRIDDHLAISDYNDLMTHVMPMRDILNLHDNDLFYMRLYIGLYVLLTFTALCLLFVMNNWHIIIYYIDKFYYRNENINYTNNSYINRSERRNASEYLILKTKSVTNFIESFKNSSDFQSYQSSDEDWEDNLTNLQFYDQTENYTENVFITTDDNDDRDRIRIKRIVI